MGWREAFQQIREDNRKMKHAEEQGFPLGMQFLALGEIDAGQSSRIERENYAREKAQRDPLGVDPW